MNRVERVRSQDPSLRHMLKGPLGPFSMWLAAVPPIPSPPPLRIAPRPAIQGHPLALQTVLMRALPLISAVIGFTAAAAAAVAGWAWLGRPVPMVDAPSGRLQCLSYTVSYQDASPIDPDFKAPAGLMEDDMRRLRPLTDCIRTYSSLGSQGDAVAAAADAGIQVMLGIWISANDAANQSEIARAIELAKAHPAAIRSIIVGNEVLLRREMTPGRLAEYIRTVRAAVSAPVTYADIYEFWRRNAKLADDVDLVTIHVLPYWDDPTPVSIDAVQAHVQGIVDKARAAFPGKPMQIGEVGWPSAGRTRGGAEPSLVNEARFIREFARNADRIGLPYNIIEAVDQHWKRRPEGTVGGYWGILDGERRLKFPLSGPVSERPDWRLAAVFSILVGFAAAIWAPWRGPGGGMAWRCGRGGRGDSRSGGGSGDVGRRDPLRLCRPSARFCDRTVRQDMGRISLRALARRHGICRPPADRSSARRRHGMVPLGGDGAGGHGGAIDGGRRPTP